MAMTSIGVAHSVERLTWGSPLSNAEVVFDFHTPTRITDYTFVTTDADARNAQRDPIEWHFDGSSDGATWTVLMWHALDRQSYPPCGPGQQLPFFSLPSQVPPLPTAAPTWASPTVAPYNPGSPSATPSSIDAVSSKSCSNDLGSWRQSGTAAVCGESDDGWACAENIRLTDAADTCRGVGARLCSAGEVVPAAMGTGCGHDGRYVWTATSCGNGYLQVKGNDADDTQCTPHGEAAAVRCCADQHAAPINAAPTNSRTATTAPTDSPTAAPRNSPSLEANPITKQLTEGEANRITKHLTEREANRITKHLTEREANRITKHLTEREANRTAKQPTEHEPASPTTPRP
eukprot:gene57328-biopygen58133